MTYAGQLFLSRFPLFTRSLRRCTSVMMTYCWELESV